MDLFNIIVSVIGAIPAISGFITQIVKYLRTNEIKIKSNKASSILREMKDLPRYDENPYGGGSKGDGASALSADLEKDYLKRVVKRHVIKKSGHGSTTPERSVWVGIPTMLLGYLFLICGLVLINYLTIYLLYSIISLGIGAVLFLYGLWLTFSGTVFSIATATSFKGIKRSLSRFFIRHDTGIKQASLTIIDDALNNDRRVCFIDSTIHQHDAGPCYREDGAYVVCQNRAEKGSVAEDQHFDFESHRFKEQIESIMVDRLKDIVDKNHLTRDDVFITFSLYGIDSVLAAKALQDSFSFPFIYNIGEADCRRDMISNKIYEVSLLKELHLVKE